MGATPWVRGLLYLTLGWTYTAHQRCNKSIHACQNLSENFCACEHHIFRFPHLGADVRLTHQRAWPHANARMCGCAGGISGVYVLAADVAFHAGHPCLTGVFRVVNQRRGWEECQSVRRAPVKSPPALSLSVLTPLNLSLSSLTLTHSTSIDTRYPAALQRPEENPLRWLSIRGEHRSLQRRKDYIMHWHTEQDASGFSACLLSFLDIYGWKKRREGGKKELLREWKINRLNKSARTLTDKRWILSCVDV